MNHRALIISVRDCVVRNQPPGNYAQFDHTSVRPTCPKTAIYVLCTVGTNGLRAQRLAPVLSEVGASHGDNMVPSCRSLLLGCDSLPTEPLAIRATNARTKPSLVLFQALAEHTRLYLLSLQTWISPPPWNSSFARRRGTRLLPQGNRSARSAHVPSRWASSGTSQLSQATPSTVFASSSCSWFSSTLAFVRRHGPT